MLKYLSYFVIAVVLAGATFFATRTLMISEAPKRVMNTIETRIAKFAGGWNKCFHNQNYGPRKNAAKRANPDSIISSMAYDLSDGPVLITGETWPRYWSISFYQQNSDVFLVKNDREIEGSEFRFVLASADQDISSLSGTPVLSPTQKGIVLIRRFAANEADMPGIVANQEAMLCGPA